MVKSMNNVRIKKKNHIIGVRNVNACLLNIIRRRRRSLRRRRRRRRRRK